MTQKKKKNSNRQKGQVLDKAATKFKQIEEKSLTFTGKESYRECIP